MYLKTLSLIVILAVAMAAHSEITVLEPLGDQFVQMNGKTTIALSKYFTGYDLTYVINTPPAEIVVNYTKALNIQPGVATTDLLKNWVAARLKRDKNDAIGDEGIYIAYDKTTFDTNFYIIPQLNGATDPDTQKWVTLNIVKTNATIQCTDLDYGSNEFVYVTCMDFTNATNPSAVIMTVNMTDGSVPVLMPAVNLANQTYVVGDTYQVRVFKNGTDKFLLRFMKGTGSFQVFDIKDPSIAPVLLDVIDSNSLNLAKLKIMNIQAHLRGVYVLGEAGTLSLIYDFQPTIIYTTHNFNMSQAVFQDFVVGNDQYPNGYGMGITVFISAIAEFGGVNSTLIYEIDWRVIGTPSQKNAYDLGQYWDGTTAVDITGTSQLFFSR